ncbi:MAG: hypothetical protein ACOH1E_06080 [Brevundimonas sp.]
MEMSARMIATACLALALTTPAQAQSRRAEPQLQVSYPTDGSLTCDQLTAEVARMDEIAGISAENAQNAENQGAMADGATGVAINAALYSGALGRVPGLGMFANAAGAAARRNAEARARTEAERVRVAQQRRTLLSGIYQGRQCGMTPAPVAVPAAPVEGVPAAEASTSAGVAMVPTAD